MKPGIHRVGRVPRRGETGDPLRQNALDPGFHGVPPGSGAGSEGGAGAGRERGGSGAGAGRERGGSGAGAGAPGAAEPGASVGEMGVARTG